MCNVIRFHYWGSKKSILYFYDKVMSLKKIIDKNVYKDLLRHHLVDGKSSEQQSKDDTTKKKKKRLLNIQIKYLICSWIDGNGDDNDNDNDNDNDDDDDNFL